jgi:hypothetical protein
MQSQYVRGGIMSQDRFCYELRILGGWVMLIPPLIILTFVLLGEMLTIMQVDHLRIAQVLTASLEMALPLAAGLLATTIVSYDTAIELQMTLPKMFRITAFVRLGLIINWTSCLALFFSLFVYHLRFWRVPAQVETWNVLQQFLIGQLTWIAPLLWFVGTGFTLALLIRSRSASSALLGGIWMLEAIFYGYFAIIDWLKPTFLFPTTLAPGISFWLSNRIEILITALVLLLIDWFMLRNTERLLQGTASED